MSESNTNIDAENAACLPVENAETETAAQENVAEEQKNENIIDNKLSTNIENVQEIVEHAAVNKTLATSEDIDLDLKSATTSSDALTNADNIMNTELDDGRDSPVLLIDDKIYADEEDKETTINTEDKAVESQEEVKNDVPASSDVTSKVSEEMTMNISEGVKELSLIQEEASKKLATASVCEESNLMELSSSNIIEIDDETDDEMKADEVMKPTEGTNMEQDKNTNVDDTKNIASSTTAIELDAEDESKKKIVTNSSQTADTEMNENATIKNADINMQIVEPMITEMQTHKDSVDAQHIAEHAKTAENIEENIKNPVKNILADYLLKKSTTKSDTPDAQDMNAEIEKNEIFYNKLCVNYDCPKRDKQYVLASMFVLSFYKISKKKHQKEFICIECYDKALEAYEPFATALSAHQPLYMKDSIGGRQEFVEIIDSDEETSDNDADKNDEVDILPKNVVDLVENELQDSIAKTLNKVCIQNQLTWCKTILYARLKHFEEESKIVDAELRALQEKTDNIHKTLYKTHKMKVREMASIHLNADGDLIENGMELPNGEVKRSPVQVNGVYYAVKNKAIASWVPCKIIEQVEGAMGTQKNLKHYKVKFLKSQYQMLKTVSEKHLAYYDQPEVRLDIGERVIAYFNASSLSKGKDKIAIQSAFYPGIIAEPLKPSNKNRYLIFYDDGYTQYVHHKDVRLVCHASENVWEDVHPASREFIQKYLTQYSINRPMVQTHRGQNMNTESNGKWIYARVMDIDCSLVLMQFEGPRSHTEWIYRGSLRLGPVFKEYQKSLEKTCTPKSRLPRRTEPFIRYTQDEEASSRITETRAVAKKSVSRQDSYIPNFAQPQNNNNNKLPQVRHLNNSTIYLEDESKPKGKVVFYTAKRNIPPKKYVAHDCSPACLYKVVHNLSAYSPLSKPLLSGWERLILRQKSKKFILYRAPCGKMLRHMENLRKYLRQTDNVLNVDNFDFSSDTNCLAEYVIDSAIVQKRDISNGLEKMAIPLVNYYDNTLPPECEYSAERIPTEGVNLNLDEEFLVGCECEDDCSDKSKCSCWQLTVSGAKYKNPNVNIDDIGYKYKRLLEHVPTGIYECNSRCKCKQNCLNRVVQHSLQMKLQVFKTSNRGWGLRCLNDIPRGSFICVYAGHLLTEAKANEGGLDAGDEYFAELDYIEVAEQLKEGYESDVEPLEPEEDEEEEEDTHFPDDDDDFTPSKSYLYRAKDKVKRSTRFNQSSNGENESQERQVINFNPNADMEENTGKHLSVRKLFGKNETCYIMDAKTIGNLGRYFNHSCSPNLYVQNVFVDTHDLRFPWVAFFASIHIRAGTELTWNYNYEVGVVPGKVLYCQCGAPNCRLRLL